MTVRQIASAAGCNHKTVRTVVDRLFPGRARKGVRLEFTESEAFSIVAKLPKRSFITPPSRKRQGGLPENGKARRLPAGVQLRELRLMAEKGLLSPANLRRLLGLPDYDAIALASSPAEGVASPEVGGKVLDKILKQIEGKPGLPAGAAGPIYEVGQAPQGNGPLFGDPE
jgi:hypothetical protein